MARIGKIALVGSGGFPHPRGDGPFHSRAEHIPEPISPPTWGWPAILLDWDGVTDDFPTHVGMARGWLKSFHWFVGFPHPRGDGPIQCRTEWNRIPISPPTWGWPGRALVKNPAFLDFPTHVGMARGGDLLGILATRFPHPRGDGPLELYFTTASQAISPPTWGWPALNVEARILSKDFPTHVGMARMAPSGK